MSHTLERPPVASAALHARLAELRPGAVAIYGLGVVAQTLVDELGEHRIAGLMDKDPANIGRLFYGLPVLGDDEVLRAGVRAIVIAASDVYWHTIAARIAPFCRRHAIAVLFLDGTPARSTADHAPAMPTADGDLDALTQRIAQHTLISFDLFDTLVTRPVSRPDELLELAVAQCQAGIDAPANLLALRKAAEARCRDAAGAFCFPLAQVYRCLVDDFAVAPPVAAALQAAELAVETRYAAPRPPLVALLRQCQATGKAVTICSDTHLPIDTLVAILRRCGVDNPPPILASWQLGASKAAGTLFDVLKARHPGASILHIGDHPEADIARARRHGLGAFRLPSPAESLRASRWRSLLGEARSTHDGVLTGLLAHHLFADPFAPTPANGRIAVATLHRFGYLFFGPLLLVWFGWLARQLRQRPADALLFLAREGHVLSRLYRTLRAAAGWHDLPPGTYFATSRRMASVAALRTADDVIARLGEPFSGSSEQLLRLRFGLSNSGAATDDTLTHSDPAAAALVARHMDAILANARDERHAYLAYIDALGITPTHRVALADLGLKGSIQHALQHLLGRALQGYYITGHFGDANPFGMRDNTAALFAQTGGDAPDQVYRFHILCESVLVAPEGMYLRARADGGFDHAPVRMNQALFECKAQIHQGIHDFFTDWLRTGIDPAHATLSPALVDAIFGSAMGDAVAIAAHVKDSFYVDEAFRAESERRIWD